jgi:hypothetical protein
MNIYDVNRIYFSRYFYSVFKSHFRSFKYVNKTVFKVYFSDIYCYKKLTNSHIKNFPFRNYFLPTYFYFNNFQYDFSWQPYKNNEEFFKKFFIIFIRFKLNKISLFYLIKLNTNLLRFNRK